MSGGVLTFSLVSHTFMAAGYKYFCLMPGRKLVKGNLKKKVLAFILIDQNECTRDEVKVTKLSVSYDSIMDCY